MVPFKNFSMWRGKLPHWRADDVTYYVTFRHSRPLEPHERTMLMTALMRPEGRRWDLTCLCILPERTELIFTVRDSPQGEAYELSDIVEKAKTKVGRAIIKKTEERFPPFYQESYDRIVRDEAELLERMQLMIGSPLREDLVHEDGGYEWLWVREAEE